MINTKDDDFYLDLKYLDRLCPPHQSKGTRLDPLSGKSLSREEAAKIDHEALDELDELLASLDDDETTEDTKPDLVEPIKAEPTKAEALRTRKRKPVAKKLVKQAQPTEDDLAEVVEELEDADLNAGISAFKEQLEGTDLAAASNNQLLQWVGEIREGVSCGEYSDETRKRFREIAMVLVERDPGILVKNCKKFAGIDCKGVASDFMNDLQRVDLYQVWLYHRGHEVDDKALGGIFAGIFCGDVFDWDKALRIATAEVKNKTLKIETKLGYLRLPLLWQAKNLVLRCKGVTADIKAANRAQYAADARLTNIETESVNIRHRLEAHANKSMSRMKSIDDYVNVWVALQLAGGDYKQLSEIKRAYERDMGLEISKSLLQRRLGILKTSLIMRP